jgi:hypothetical protein
MQKKLADNLYRIVHAAEQLGTGSRFGFEKEDI